MGINYKQSLKIFTLNVIGIFIFIQSTQAQSNDAYNFPVKPGTPEWNNLKTYEERLNAYNMPDDILEKISTRGLVKTCLNYPEFRLVMTRNNLQYGYDYIYSIFNGFRELESRKDGGKELIDEYKNLNPSKIADYNSLIEQGKYSFELTYIELILAQSGILSNMNTDEINELGKTCISYYDIKSKLSSQYSTFGLSTTTLILVRILESQKNSELIIKKTENDNLQKFIDFGYSGDNSTLSEIYNISKKIF